MKKLKVVELFAGVGGFRLGLEGWEGMSASSSYTRPLKGDYEVVWSNQWEPSTKRQHAHEVYMAKFPGSNHSNENISKVSSETIPDHDLLVGGFPCQDYSVATTLRNAGGLLGKKGVLWWEIERILHDKIKANAPIKYLLLENVDRLLKSPARQRGRDFAIMLKTLNSLGYAVEWRVINAAEYGMPQKRKRIFILGYHKSTALFGRLSKNKKNWHKNDSVLAQAFPGIKIGNEKNLKLEKKLEHISINFGIGNKKSDFLNSGTALRGQISTCNLIPLYCPIFQLQDILRPEPVENEFYLNGDYDKWVEAKNSVSIERTTSNGFSYEYKMGKMKFPDPIHVPSRTIVTGEGGKAASRFKHVIDPGTGNFRRLTPEELEALNMFPIGHTELEKITNTKRAFFMGNALVIGVVERIGKFLAQNVNPR